MFNVKNGDVILFQGDSITDGNRGRSQDPNHIHGHGYQYIIASEMYADNFDKDFTVINRGISGNTVSDLQGRWQADCLDLKPTVLSVLVGVNDAHFMFEKSGGSAPGEYKNIYRNIINQALEQNPDLMVVVMEPFFGVSKNIEYNKYMQAHIGGYREVAKELAEEYNAVFVPLQDLFDSYARRTDIFKLLWDGVHPTTGGHQLIARRWKECAEEHFNKR